MYKTIDERCDEVLEALKASLRTPTAVEADELVRDMQERIKKLEAQLEQQIKERQRVESWNHVAINEILKLQQELKEKQNEQ